MSEVNKIQQIVKDSKGVWKSESAFWSWIKGQIRRAWSHHPIKVQFINEKRYKIPNPNIRGNPKVIKKEVWGARCESCKNEFALKDMEVNHNSRTTASLTKLDDIQGCVEKLLVVDFNDLEYLCKECHQNFTLAQKRGISVEDAKIEKKIIEFNKLKAEDQKKFLSRYMIPIKVEVSKNKREEQYRNILKENQNAD